MKYAVFDVMRKRKNWFIFFFIGLLAGTVYANIKWFDSLNEVNSFITYWSDRIQGRDIDHNDFMKYVFINRLKEVFIILVFNLTITGKTFNCFYLFYLGYSSAMVEAILTLKYGYRALIIYSASIFPHYIVYGLLITYCIVLCEALNDAFFKHKSFGIGRINAEKIILMFKYSFIILIMILIESIMEAYININVLV